MTLNTRTAHTQKQSYRLWSGADDKCKMSHGTYIHRVIYRILNYIIEIYIWNQTGNNNSVISFNTPSWPHQRLPLSNTCMPLGFVAKFGVSVYRTTTNRCQWQWNEFLLSNKVFVSKISRGHRVLSSILIHGRHGDLIPSKYHKYLQDNHKMGVGFHMPITS